jgi:D-tyrosyl-tRNA(Tyr) deacylase
MRAVIQRVSQASVSIGGQTRGAIQQGLMVLLGIEASDTREDSQWLADKIARLRIFDDREAVMNKSIIEIGGDILLVSQFTLFASTRKGNRPSYSRAASAQVAIPIYEDFVSEIGKALGRPIITGEFGAQMKVSLVNDGPVTILIDTKVKE